MIIGAYIKPNRDRALMSIGFSVHKWDVESKAATVLDGYAPIEDEDYGGLPYVQAFGIRVYYRRKS